MCLIAAVYIKSSVKSELEASVALRNGLCSVTGSKPAWCGSHDGDALPVCASGSTAALGMARVPLKRTVSLRWEELFPLMWTRQLKLAPLAPLSVSMWTQQRT